MEQGIVYVLTNPCMPGIVKIGMSEKCDIDQRMKDLYSTGVPLPFECQFACKVKVTDCRKIERALHTAFAPQRVNTNREFFRIVPEQAIAILELFHHEDVTEEVAQEIENDLTPEDKAAQERSRSKRPPLDFLEMGLQVGDTLVWKDDPTVTVRILSARKVEYKGEECSLSALSAQLKGYHVKHISPCSYWSINDQPLSEIYDAKYPLSED